MGNVEGLMMIDGKENAKATGAYPMRFLQWFRPNLACFMRYD